MTVLHVTGARPNLPKAAPVVRALRSRGVEQVVVHTGQHYDDGLTTAILDDVGLRPPDIDLGIGPGTATEQTAAVMLGLERVVRDVRPGLVVVYGDVSSTVAAALVAVRTGIRLAHVEAGLRSFDRSMPEELNRLVTDQLADVLLAPSDDAVDNLRRESVAGSIALVGNVMIDSLRRAEPTLDPAAVQDRLGIAPPYAVATLHRPSNVDDAGSVALAVGSLRELCARVPAVLPLHPRGRDRLLAAGADAIPGLTVTDPLGYRDFLALVAGAAVVVTDSGGVQEETSVLGVPCLTLRDSTERPVTVTLGTNRLVTPATLGPELDAALGGPRPSPARIPLWDGRAGERIADVLAGQGT